MGGRVEFVQFPVAICTGLGENADPICERPPARIVLVDGRWDGNGLCDSEECAAMVIADFDFAAAMPWSEVVS